MAEQGANDNLENYDDDLIVVSVDPHASFADDDNTSTEENSADTHAGDDADKD